MAQQPEEMVFIVLGLLNPAHGLYGLVLSGIFL